MKRKGKSPMKHASHSAESNPATVDEPLYWSKGRENIYLQEKNFCLTLQQNGSLPGLENKLRCYFIKPCLR
nr:hypothetical protein Iba_chr13bCG8850 [Ipomoea batatas]